jgi:glycosyltransferase involved in cell wall biosynthesis
MIVKNESKKLARCLSSVTSIANEIIVVDTGSEDNTKEIAYSFNAKVFDFKWTNSFAEARNYSISKSTGDYNLIIDADEYVTKCDVDKLQRFMENNNTIGKIKLIDLFNNKDRLDREHTYITRFLPKGIYYTRKIHEQIDSVLPRMNTPIELTHDGYVDRDNAKFHRNIDLLKLEIKENPQEAYNYYQIAKEYNGLKDYKTATEFYEKGYKTIQCTEPFYPNLIINYMSNLISTKNLEKVISLISESEKNLTDYPDFYFACGVFYMELVMSNVKKYIQYFSLIEKSYLKCIEIGETNKYGSVFGTGSFSALYNLGTFYESSGNLEKAIHYYALSAEYNYDLAIDRLKVLNNTKNN